MPNIPINRVVDKEKLVKALDGYAPSWRDPITHPYKHNNPQSDPKTADRFVGNQMARRYVNGALDMDYLLHQVIEVIHKIKEGEVLTPPEESLLALINPAFKTPITEGLAKTYLRVTDDEVNLLRLKLQLFLAAERNWQAGHGGGTVPGADTTKDRY